PVAPLAERAADSLVYVHHLIAGEQYLCVLLPASELVVGLGRQLEKPQREVKFGFFRRAAKGDAIRSRDAILVALAELLHASGERLRLTDHEFAIECEQLLLRNGRYCALVGGHVCVRKVEQTQKAIEFVTAHLRVDRPALGARVAQIEGRPAR